MLGIEIEISEKGIRLSQDSNATELLNERGPGRFDSVPLPMEPSLNLPVTLLDEDVIENSGYQISVGQLMYLARGTRPELAFAAGYLARFSQRPGKIALTGVKEVHSVHPGLFRSIPVLSD